jgi:hypothetical protein
MSTRTPHPAAVPFGGASGGMALLGSSVWLAPAPVPPYLGIEGSRAFFLHDGPGVDDHKLYDRTAHHLRAPVVTSTVTVRTIETVVVPRQAPAPPLLRPTDDHCEPMWQLRGCLGDRAPRPRRAIVGQSRSVRDGRDGLAHRLPSRADASARTACGRGEGASSCRLVKARERHDTTVI